MESQTHWLHKGISLLSILIGSTSLFFFVHFVLFGPFGLIDLRLSNLAAVSVNIIFSLLFFIQHSVMIRRSVRQIIERILPPETFYAFHSICSGILLCITLLLWQETDLLIYTIPKPYSYIADAFIGISLGGLLWAIRSLTEFDPFGRKKIRNFIKSQEPKKQVFTLRGAYKITRHPFYFFILLMIWAYSDVTLDRLVFALIWTIWVIIGTVLEERDLVREIGEDYVQYQATVPMLLPYKFMNYFK